MLDRAALTQGASAHPLANGVRRVELTGLDAEPVLREDGGRVRLEGRGFTADLAGARWEKTVRTLTVRIGVAR